MGIILTKYETSTDIIFDKSKFDYYYDDDTFPSETANDFNEILDEHGNTFTITRQTDTVDSLGDVTNVSNITFDILGIIRDITTKDRKIHEMGLAISGNSKFYFKPKYTISSVDYEIKEGDIVTDLNSRKWRVIKILKQVYLPNQEVYRIAIINNINLD